MLMYTYFLIVDVRFDGQEFLCSTMGKVYLHLSPLLLSPSSCPLRRGDRGEERKRKGGEEEKKSRRRRGREVQ